MQRIKKNLGLIGLILLSCVLTPVTHDVIKPYRLRVDLTLHYENPTNPEIYFSTSRKSVNYFRGKDTVPFVTPESNGAAPSFKREVAYIASKKPITNLRLDPSNNANKLTISALSVHSLFSDTDFSTPEILELLKKGEHISGLQSTDNGLQFETVGDDAHFLLPIPVSIGVPTRFEAAMWYVFSWLLSLSLLFLVKISVFAPHSKFNNNGALPIRIGKVSLYLPTISSRAYNLLGICLLGYALTRFVGLTVGMDFSHVRKAFDRDRFSNAIPAEVFWIKTLVERQGVDAFVLAGNLGKGEDEGEIYQRATEFLYPIRVDAHAKWVVARGNDLETSGRKDCKVRDHQDGVALYECEK